MVARCGQAASQPSASRCASRSSPAPNSGATKQREHANGILILLRVLDPSSSLAAQALRSPASERLFWLERAHF